MNMTDLFKKARIVDLSERCVPGEYDRRLEIRQFKVEPGEVMHDIDMNSHIGTHVEAPSHYITPCFNKPSKDLSELPIESFLGEAIFADLSVLGPKEPVSSDFLKEIGVKKDDIVIMGNCKHMGDDQNYLAAEAAKYMADIEIKMLGLDKTFKIEEWFEPLDQMYTHRYLMGKDIPLIERMENLSALKERRFFFIGIPVAIVGLDSFPIRAIALENVL
jgi:kynurenine formamidase